MNISLLGAGYWGSKIAKELEILIPVNDIQIVDIKDGKTIDDVSHQNVIVATPALEHYTHTCTLLDRGHNVYVEKPLAMNAEQCINIKNKMQSQIVLVGHIFLYNDRLHKVKEILDQNIIGDIQYIESNRLNWGFFQTEMSTLHSLAPHDVSIVHYLLGYAPFTDIKYNGVNLSRKVQNDIDAFTFKCKNVDVKFNLSWYYPAKIRTLVIVGTQGMIFWDEEKRTITMYNKLWLDDKMNYDTMKHPHNYDVSCNPLRNQIKDFVNCIEDSSRPVSDVDCAINVAKNIDLLNYSKIL